MKKIAIMQSYFLPYIGYWQLINCVDEFIVYDNIEYTKKGWFNRNRILETNHDRLFTIPIKKDSDYLPVNERYLSDDSDKEIARTLRIIESSYRKAPHFSEAYPVIKECFLFPNKNLFSYNYHSIQVICEYLGIETNIVISSEVDCDHTLKAAEKVIAICKARNTTMYVNAIGGIDLYNAEEFEANSIELKFIKSRDITYTQFNSPFVPRLSIIDSIMFNGKDETRKLLDEYELV